MTDAGPAAPHCNIRNIPWVGFHPFDSVDNVDNIIKGIPKWRFVDDSTERSPSDASRMVSFQIPAHWMPWIEKERAKRGLRTRSDFFRRAVRENLEIYVRDAKVTPDTIVIPHSLVGLRSLAKKKIRVEIHESLKRAVGYFSELWHLDPERGVETLQLATRTFRYLLDEEGGKGGEEEVSGGTVLSRAEKMMVLSASGTAVKVKLGEIGLVEDPVFGEIPEIVLEFELDEEVETAVFRQDAA